MSMYNTAKGLSGKYQRQVRNKVYEAVSQAEEENELEKTTRTSSVSPSFSEETGSSSSSSTTLLTTQYPDFFLGCTRTHLYTGLGLTHLTILIGSDESDEAVSIVNGNRISFDL
jgi:hypothetical protein